MEIEKAIKILEPYKKSVFGDECEKYGGSISVEEIIELLKELEVKELTIEEWQAWKKDKNHDPICLLWEHDCTPIWILDANNVHEPALLMGKCKLFKGKPSHEQCRAVKWE